MSAIVERRYRLLRTATALTWAGIVLTMCAAIAQRLWGAVGHSGTSAGADWT